MWRRILVLVVLLWSSMVLGAPKVTLVGLFPGKAVLTVDARRHVLSEGASTPEGVRLVRVGDQAVVVEIEGQRRTLGMSRSVGGSYASPKRRQVTIARNNAGMFTTTGSINGLPMSFLVDTGASVVAMNAADARRLGIDFRVQGTRMMVNTASGVARAYQVFLDSVTVGEITVRNVRAAVVDGPAPHVPLLGMSYLGKVKMRHEGQLLVLEEAY